MSKRKLKELAEGIWGAHWKTRLSEYLEVTIQTVMRWANGTNPVPHWLILLLTYRSKEK